MKLDKLKPLFVNIRKFLEKSSSFKIYTLVGLSLFFLAVVVSSWFVRHQSQDLASQAAKNKKDFVLEVEASPLVDGRVPIDSITRLTFTIKNENKVLVAGDKYCIEFPVNRKGVIDAKRRALWSLPQLDQSDQPGYINLQQTAGLNWKQTVVSSGLVDNGYCLTLDSPELPLGSVIKIVYTGYSQRLVRPVRFKARYVPKVGNGQAENFLAANVLTFKPGRLHTFNVKLPMNIEPLSEFSLEVAALDEFGNRKDNFIGSVELKPSVKIFGLPDKIEFKKEDRGYKQIAGLKVDQVGFLEVEVKDKASEVYKRSNYAYVQSGGLKRFIGDTQFHTGYGMPDPFLKMAGDHMGNYSFGDVSLGDYAYTYAKKTSLLDFVVHSEHVSNGLANGGYVIDDPNYDLGYSYKLNNQLADKQYSPGRFTTFYGYEWGGGVHYGGGHHIVVIYNKIDNIYKASYSLFDFACNLAKNPNCVHRKECTPENRCYATRPDLVKALEKDGAEFIMIPHTMNWTNLDKLPDYDSGLRIHPIWDNFNQAHLPIGEIYSYHNDREKTANFNQALKNEVSPYDADSEGWSYRLAWYMGHKIGVIGSTDNHYGTPGLDNISDKTEDDGGLAVVLAQSNTRESIWSAINRRRVYGTSGPRIYLDFTADNHAMGSYYQTDKPPRFRLVVGGTEPLVKVQLWKLSRFKQLPKQLFLPQSTSQLTVMSPVEQHLSEEETYFVGDDSQTLSSDDEATSRDLGVTEVEEDSDSAFDDGPYELVAEFTDFQNQGYTLETELLDTNFSRDSMYYVRVVQVANHEVPEPHGEEVAWSSPIWIDYGSLKGDNLRPYVSERKFQSLVKELLPKNDYQVVFRDLDGVPSPGGGIKLIEISLESSTCEPNTKCVPKGEVLELKFDSDKTAATYAVEKGELVLKSKKNQLPSLTSSTTTSETGELLLKDDQGQVLAEIDKDKANFVLIDAVPNLKNPFETLVFNFSIKPRNESIKDKFIWFRVLDNFGSRSNWHSMALKDISYSLPGTTETPTLTPTIIQEAKCVLPTAPVSLLGQDFESEVVFRWDVGSCDDAIGQNKAYVWWQVIDTSTDSRERVASSWSPAGSNIDDNLVTVDCSNRSGHILRMDAFVSEVGKGFMSYPELQDRETRLKIVRSVKATCR